MREDDDDCFEEDFDDSVEYSVHTSNLSDSLDQDEKKYISMIRS